MSPAREHRTRSNGNGNGSQARSRSTQSSASSTNARPKLPEIVERVREQLPTLLGRPVEAILGVERDDDGWAVLVQVVELSRIPQTTDVLGAYEVTTDARGEVSGYRRRRRYHRNQIDEE
jgi:hypothetical protein